MRSNHRTATCVLAVAGALLMGGLAGVFQAQADELLANGGFEAGVASEWGAAGGALVVQCGDGAAEEGDCSALFTAETPGGGLIQHTSVPVAPGGVYAVSASVVKDDPAVDYVELRIKWFDNTGAQIGSSLPSGTYSNSPDYQRLVIASVAADAAAVKAAVTVRVVSSSAGAQIRIDRVSIAGPSAPSPIPDTPTSTATPSSAPSATPTPISTATRLPTATATRASSPTPVPTATPLEMAHGSLHNGGFEDADGGSLTAWHKYGGYLSQTAVYRRSGQFAASFAGDTDSTKWVYQAVSIDATKAYAFEGHALVDDPAVESVQLRISWYSSSDASGTALAVSESPTMIACCDPTFRYLTTGPVLPPANARSAKVRAVLAPASAAPAVVYLDDMALWELAAESVVAPSTPSPPVPSLDFPEAESPDGTPASEARGAAENREPDEGGDSPYQVKINEVLYDPSQKLDEAAHEWVELYNASSEPVDLAGWSLSDNQGTDALPSLPLAPGAFAVIAATSTVQTDFPAFNAALVTLADGRIGNGLAGAGDRLTLRDNAGRLVDALSYGDDREVFSPSVADVAEGHSIERSPPGKDTGSAADFVDNPNPSPGTALSKRQVLSSAVTRQGSSQLDPPPIVQEDGSGPGTWAWVTIGAGLFALGTGIGTASALLWRRSLNKG